MDELYDREGDVRESKLLSDALINLYAAHVHSLLYPYNHPLISDSLKNAFQLLRKIFYRKPKIRLEIIDGRLMIDGEILDGNAIILGNFASWLQSLDIKTLSFARGLTRRELISFHKLISTEKMNIDEFSNVMTQKSIVNITVHTLDLSVRDDSISSLDDSSQKGLIQDFEDTMYHSESEQDKSPFFIRPATVSPYDDASHYGLIKDFVIKEKQQEIDRTKLPYEPDSDESRSMHEMSEGDRYAEYVEALIDRDVPDDYYSVISSIPPEDLAHFLNTMLFSTPSGEVIERVMRAYFRRDETTQNDEMVERCRVFLSSLKLYLRPSFFAGCISLFDRDDNIVTQLSDMFPEEVQEASTLSITNGNPDTSSENTEFIPCRTIQSSDFTFDFVSCGNAVLHDIEISSETASLLNEEHIAYYQNEGVLDTLSSSALTASNDPKFQAEIIMECTDEAITDASFDVMLELLESNSLDDEMYQKLEARTTALVKVYAENGDLERVLDLLNSLKTQSLQGKCCDLASRMIRSIFSSEKVIAKVVETLRQYGRKRRDSAYKLTTGLQSFIVPYLLDALSEESNTSTRRFIMSLLTSISSESINHITKRLRGSSWYVLRNMLYLLRECRARSCKKVVRSFLDHELPLVRLEALKTLLSFQDSEADTSVIKFLNSNVLELQKGAVRLSGTYRIKKAVPHLLHLLKEKDISIKNFSFKKTIIRALGSIGDSRAVSYLLNICRSKGGIHQKKIEKLKIEIFRTLHNYPATTIGSLIEYGMNSTNKEILEISEKLKKRYGLSTVTQS